MSVWAATVYPLVSAVVTRNERNEKHLDKGEYFRGGERQEGGTGHALYTIRILEGDAVQPIRHDESML